MSVASWVISGTVVNGAVKEDQEHLLARIFPNQDQSEGPAQPSTDGDKIMYCSVLLTRISPFLGAACGLAVPLFLNLSMSLAIPTTGSQQVSSQLSASILAAGQGAIVDVGDLSMPDLPTIPYRKEASGPQFVFSDDPEYIRVPEGATVRETLKPGRARLYLYHVNATTDTLRKKISAVVENLGDAPLSLRIIRCALPPPSAQYYQVGKTGLAQFLQAVSDERPILPVVSIAPRGSAVLDEALDALRPGYDELVHGWYEFEIDQPARLTVLQTAPDASTVEANGRITTVLPPRRQGEGAGRGLFTISTYDVQGAEEFVLDSASGPLQLVVADGMSDPWITGHDDSRSSVAINKGNYGVVYKIRLRRTSSDGRGLALLMYNYRTGAKWCDSMAAAVRVGEGLHEQGVVEIPTGRLNVTGLDQGVVIQIFPPLPAGHEDIIEVVYSPPGGSCLPTPLVFVPVEMAIK